MHLKNLVLRAWWDGEATPSVEVPIGDFFGLGLGEYFTLPVGAARRRAHQGAQRLLPDAVCKRRPPHRHQRGHDPHRQPLLRSRLRDTPSLPAGSAAASTRSTARPPPARAGPTTGPTTGAPASTTAKTSTAKTTTSSLKPQAADTLSASPMPSAKPGRLVRRRRRHDLHRWRHAAHHQRHRH